MTPPRAHPYESLSSHREYSLQRVAQNREETVSYFFTPGDILDTTRRLWVLHNVSLRHNDSPLGNVSQGKIAAD